MLVLSRKADQAIAIGNDVTIKVVSISGGRVRLAIDAPRHIRVMRQELADSKFQREPAQVRELELV